MAVEHHALDVPWWTDVVTGIAPDYLADGYVTVPEAPGLGLTSNEDVIREHLVEVVVDISTRPTSGTPSASASSGTWFSSETSSY